jgi:hypothetical protein
MPLTRLKVFAIVVALLITLGALLAGQSFYEKNIVNRDLTQKIRAVVPNVAIRVAKDEQPPTVYVSNAQVSDLQSTYSRLDKVVSQQLSPDYRVVLVDRRSVGLQDALEQCQFSIQEAIATGSFQKMQKTVQQITGARQVNSQISVDNDNVYLTLSDGDGYLYGVISRTSKVASKNSSTQTGGGGL